MSQISSCCSGQEARIALPLKLLNRKYADRSLARAVRILRRYIFTKPIFDWQRGWYFTESMSLTEGMHISLRWAKAMRNVVEHIDVYVDKDQLLAGAVGGEGRYGIMFPELDGSVYLKVFQDDDCPGCTGKAAYTVSKETARLAKKMGEYWAPIAFLKPYERSMPADVHHVTYDEHLHTNHIVSEWQSCMSSSNWTPDWGKVLNLGLKHIRRQAQEHISALDPMDPEVRLRKRPFYDAVIITCDNLKIFATRHAELLEKMASEETDVQRKNELVQMAEFCRYVPENPARSFWEAMQSLWLLQLYSRLESKFGGIVVNGRMDQYLYPFYKADRDKGIIDDEGVLELLNCLWAAEAKFVDVYVSSVGSAGTEGFSHFDAVTVGGQNRDGMDATNELSYLLLRCAREFPANYPDVAARIHACSPREFLWAVAETIKDGEGYPKLLNDEEIIPSLMSFGAQRSDALDYSVSGCTEVRMPNRDTFLVCPSHVCYGSVVEAALYNGRLPLLNDCLYGLETGPAESFSVWEDFLQAVRLQHDYFFSVALFQVYTAKKMFGRYYASPLASAMHDLCMADAKDLHEENIRGGINIGFIDGVGFGTLIDSLCAIHKFVYEEKRLTMRQVIDACRNNFQGEEGVFVQSILKHGPKHCNNDPAANRMAYLIDTWGTEIMSKYNHTMGVSMTLRMVPVTSHIPHGKAVGATPNGRLAGLPMSEGASASHGADTSGPAAVLLSNYASKNLSYKERCSRLLNIKFTPGCVAGDKGTEKLIDFIRTWCALKLWHVQFNVVNRETLLAAQKDPEAYKSLIVRVAGYSAFFCELSEGLQNEIIERTTYDYI
ncbi:pyruvate formate lyase family protein [uncultured Mailhella sp.]|uniref:(2S)-3-sulfopropanediol dehydratase n=1 Tax=uncultured Mailhella sp. TaxID=1981031 RepID=UPI0025FFA5F1|nr:pyruvate formate lyase family protein [uncultured Mailhella sp.]